MAKKGNVKFCPINKETWESRAIEHDCGGLNSYHCLSDTENRKWEGCVEKALIKEGNCPIFSSKRFIDWKPCNISMSTCPNSSFISNEVYKFPGCFGNNTINERSVEDQTKNDGISDGLIIGVVLCILLILAVVLIVVYMYQRRKHSNLHNQEELAEQENLIPDGVNEEIVKNTDVISGFNELKNKEVRSIVVVGKFGSSVFSTSRRISERFKLEEKWESMECRYTDIPDTIGENTIMYVYGWFGMWNDDLCSAGRAEMACKSLIRILNETNNVKLIVGMRSDLYKKYHQVLLEADDDKNTSLFHHEIYLDNVDVRKHNEYKIYFEENIQKQCKENDCACKRLTYEMLRKGKDKDVGMPLKINTIQRYHELIPNYLHNWDILKVMRDHFGDMEIDGGRKYVYEWIMYICLKGKFSRFDEFDSHLVEQMGFEIEQSSFDENDTELSRYVRIRNSDKLRNESPENAQYVFWHSFIYICAFHFLFRKNPEIVMIHCNMDAILQLVRPSKLPRGLKMSYFEVIADSRCIALFNKRIRFLGKEKEYIKHPLFKINAEELMGIGVTVGLEMLKLFNTSANQS